jgi:periplasmic divalent cation tolerance protein
VGERLAACVNVHAPMTSIYRWEGKVEEAQEHQLTIKTTASRTADVIARIQELHPYDVPEILVLPVADGGDAYLRWIREMTS